MDSAIYIALPFSQFPSSPSKAVQFGKTSGFPRSRWSAQMASTMYIVDTCSRTEGFVLRTGHMQDRHVHPLQAMMACDTLKIISCSVFLGVTVGDRLVVQEFGGKKPGFDSRNKGLVVVFGSACNNPDEVVGFTWQGHLEERTYGSTKPVRFLHGNIFCKVWKKIFFSGFVCVGWKYWGLQLATVSRTSNVRHQQLTPSQGNRGGWKLQGLPKGREGWRPHTCRVS